MNILKKITFQSPIVNKNIFFLFSFLFLANSVYYAYHAVFTPFVQQAINCRLIYLFLIVAFVLLSFIKDKNEKTNWRKTLEIFILILLPSAILIAFGYFFHPGSFKNNSRFFANLVIVASSLIFFLKISRRWKMGSFFFKAQKNKSTETNKDKKKPNFLMIFILALVIIANLSFGSYHLSKFAAVDEPLWTFERIPKFWNNVLDGEWQKTMISDKPGITIALISGIGTLWTNPKEYKLIEQEEEIKVQAGEIEKMNFPMRFPVLLFSALALIVFYYLLSKLFNSNTALLSVLFIGLSPILLGISRIINPDSLFWIFSSLSLLSFFLSIKNPRNSYLVLCGIFLGLSLLTKYVANILFVFYFGLIFIDFFLNDKHENREWKNYFQEMIKKYLVIIYFSVLTFFILLPAAWVNLGRIAQGTVLSEAFTTSWKLFLIFILFTIFEAWILKGKIFGFIFSFLSKNKKIIFKIFCFIFLISIIIAALNTLFNMRWFNFESILASPKSNILNPKSVTGAFLANFYPLVFGIHPLALLFSVIAIAGIFFSSKNKYWSDSKKNWIVYISLFIFFYYTASFLSKVGATVRYQIVIYPLIFIIAAVGMDFVLNRFEKTTRIISIAIIALLLIVSMENIRPFYFSYASEILPKKYILNLKDMGDGSYEAAQYLNSLPDAENLIVWTDKRGVCYFFKGGCFGAFELNRGRMIDYFVISAGREIRTARHIPYKGRHNDFEVQVDKIYELDNYDYRLDIGGRPNNYIKIFSYERLAGEKN